MSRMDQVGSQKSENSWQRSPLWSAFQTTFSDARSAPTGCWGLPNFGRPILLHRPEISSLPGDWQTSPPAGCQFCLADHYQSSRSPNRRRSSLSKYVAAIAHTALDCPLCPDILQGKMCKKKKVYLSHNRLACVNVVKFDFCPRDAAPV